VRVLVTIFEELVPLSGGGTPRISNIIRTLTRKGHEVHVASSLGVKKEDAVDEMECVDVVPLLKVSRLSSKKMLRYLYAHPLNIRRVARYARKIKPDLIISHNSVAGFAALLAKRSQKDCLAILDLTDLLFEYLEDYPSGAWMKLVQLQGKRLERKTIRESDKIVTVSDSMKNILLTYGAESEDIEVVCDGVDTDIFRRTDERKMRSELGKDVEDIVIFQGVIDPQDGPQIILDAAREVVKKHRQTMFWIIGDGTALPALKRRVAEESLAKYFYFSGWVRQDEVARYISVSDLGLVILPDSLSARGRVTLKEFEYWACGIPVIVPRLPALEEVVEEGKTGFFYEPGDSKSLARKIMLLIENKDLRKENLRGFREEILVMRVLLIVPGTYSWRYPGQVQPHTGIAYLAGVLKKNGIEVRILDMGLRCHTKQLFPTLDLFRPQLIGITVFSLYHKRAYDLIHNIKNHGEYQVVLGGPHISAIRDTALRKSEADFAVKGEGEKTLLQLRCIFCSVRLCMGGKFRARSPENVVAEIEHWCEQGWKNYEFQDDNFTSDMTRAKRICEAVVSKNLTIKWSLPNGIRADKVDRELLEKMKESGCFRIALGVESANNDVLRKIKKGTRIERVEETVEMMKQVGMELVGFFIVGHPTETYERFMESIEFAKRMPFDQVSFWNMIPYPGTELLEWVRENATLLYPEEVYLNRASHCEGRPVFETDDFSAEERTEAYQLGRSLERKSIAYWKMGKFWGPIGLAISSFPILERTMVRLIKTNPIARFFFKALSFRAGENRAGTCGE